MKNIYIYILLIGSIFTACDERDPDVEPLDENFPFRFVLDADEGADLPNAEDYGLEVALADFLGEAPAQPVTLTYEFSDLEDDFVGNVEIDEIIYTVEIDDCEFERTIDFTGNQINITVDDELGSIPLEFEIVFALPGLDDTEGSFAFTITDIQTNGDILLNEATTFEYEVLDSELAGDWLITLTEDEYAQFQEFFSLVNEEILDVDYSDFADGEVAVEFGFEEMKFEIELLEEEEVCEDGETELEALTVEIEFEWDADEDEGEIEFEGERTFDDDGIASEADVIAEAEYTINGDQLELIFTSLIDEDNYEEGEELFAGSRSFILIKD